MKILKLLLLPALACIVISQLAIVCDDVLKIPVDTKYQYSLNANGGKSPYTYSATGLPDGISISEGSIVGQSDVVGVFPVVITVNDGDKSTANKHIFIYITSPISSSSSNSEGTTITKTITSSTSITNDGIQSVVPTVVGNSENKLFQSSSVVSNNNNNNQIRNLSFAVNVPQQSTQTLTNSVFSVPSQQTGSFVINVPNQNTRVLQLSSNNINVQPERQQPTFVTNTPLIVPTTTPYLTNYSFASSLQSTPTISSTQPAEAAFQRQSNINKAISSLLSMIQGFNATLLTIQNDIPNTTSLLNDAIKNQRVAQAQLNSIIAQNTSLTNNMTGIQTGIKTLQNQMLTTTNALNGSNAQVQTLQTKITQNYIQINETKNKIQNANKSLQQASQKRNKTAEAIHLAKDNILKITQLITSTQTDINNSPAMLTKLTNQINNQKTVILALQKQLEAAILALVPIQTQFDYYTMIPMVGPGLIQQNKTIMLLETDNLAKAQPVYDSSKNDIQTYNNLINQLSTAMNSLQNQLAADQLAYNNIVGSQNNQEGLFNNTLITIAAQTQLLNKIKQQQQNLLSGPYPAAQQVASDSTSKVNQLTQTLNSLNKRYQQVQSNLVSTQKTLNDAIKQKQLIDQQVNQVIQGGGSSSSTIAGGSNIKIEIKGN